MDREAQRVLTISHSSDIVVAGRMAETMASAIGFDDRVSGEIELVARELASNLVKHAHGGTLAFTKFSENEQTGIQIESKDSGPGIADIEQAVADGFSTTGSLGCGLGAVNRLMDDFHIASNHGGTCITCKRRLPGNSNSAMTCPLDLGAAMRPHPQMSVSGDAYVLKKWDDYALASVIDGLGHGQFAHRASEKARDYIEHHFSQPLDEIFRGVERSCRGTRGVVMALTKVDYSRKILQFSSIGNVEARVYGSTNRTSFIIRRGIIGGKAIMPVINEHPWEAGSVMALYSDGIRTHWRWEDFPGLFDESASAIASRLLHALARDNDDATVVIIKEGSPCPKRI